MAFKLAQGLMQRRLDAKDQARLSMSFMKVVAIATIADAVPLLGENRVFAKLGLEGLRRPVNVGLKALLEVAKLGDGRALTATEVAFRIAPRMNAAGRMDVARDVVDLFNERDIERARKIAGRLDELNAGRQVKSGGSWKASCAGWMKTPRFARRIAWCSTARVGIAGSLELRHRGLSNATDVRRWSSHGKAKRRTVRDVRSRRSICCTRWSLVRNSFRDTEGTRTPWDSPCRVRILRNYASIWMSMPAHGLLPRISNRSWNTSASFRCLRSLQNFIRR